MPARIAQLPRPHAWLEAGTESMVFCNVIARVRASHTFLEVPPPRPSTKMKIPEFTTRRERGGGSSRGGTQISHGTSPQSQPCHGCVSSRRASLRYLTAVRTSSKDRALVAVLVNLCASVMAAREGSNPGTGAVVGSGGLAGGPADARLEVAGRDGGATGDRPSPSPILGLGGLGGGGGRASPPGGAGTPTSEAPSPFSPSSSSSPSPGMPGGPVPSASILSMLVVE